MTILLTNEEISNLVSMRQCMEALEEAYQAQARGNAVNQMRYDTNMHLPDRPENKARYEFKTMVGILPHRGVAALRMSSTINYSPEINGSERSERLYLAPGGTTVGLVQLFSIETGEPLAILPDGYIQGLRVGASYGIATKYLARDDASIVGLVGSGWQARFQVAATCAVREVRRIKVFSPNHEHRMAFASEMTEQQGVPVEPVDTLEAACEAVDILTAATNAAGSLIGPEYVLPGMHVSSVRYELSKEALKKAHVLAIHTDADSLRYFGGSGLYGTRRATPNHVTYDAAVRLDEVVAGLVDGRKRRSDITAFTGHGLGIQFAAVASRVYELARAQGVGRTLPTEWFTQTLHT